MDLGLRGKKAIISGATRGIGRSIAECLATEGCDVAICARTATEVNEAVSAMRVHGVNAMGSNLDVANTSAFAQWINQAAEDLGGLDIYISTVSAQSFDWARSFEVDIQACVSGVEAALPHLKKSDHGSIVAIASQAALLSVPSYKPYSAMKAALISYMSSLSRELAPLGIRVNVVSPGEIYFEGGFWQRMEQEDPDLVAEALHKNILGRFGTPLEVARAAVFLASPAASFISGTNLLVDGASKEHVQF
ncbi:MAG TPA: SDR family oxidoreductase [Ktedonobacteraceae bacterium]|nr:SDR family oxidoreductase [Ktedonobacteraceae bacterium]